MTPSPPKSPGCLVYLAIFVGEVVAAIVVGFIAFAIGTSGFDWTVETAVPVALFAGLGGAFIVDRLGKRMTGDSVMRGVAEMLSAFP